MHDGPGTLQAIRLTVTTSCVYTKGGVLVGVTVFGDMRDLEAPEKFGLLIVGWDYSESLNVILIDD